MAYTAESDEFDFAASDLEEEEFVLDLIRTYDIENSLDRGYRLLQEATKHKHKAATKLLIERGAAVNTDKYFASYTPLHWAVRSGDCEIVELLLNRGAVINDESWGGLSPFYLAASGEVEVTHLYLTNNEEVGAGSASKSCHQSADMTSIVSLLLSRGSDVNQKLWEGQTPLHVACNSRSHLRDSTIEVLLEQGANVNICDNFSYTPLHVVAVSDIPNPCTVIDKLLQYGADINAKTYTEETPLHASCRSQSPEQAKVVQMLVKAGANVNAKSLRGCTPLHMSLSNFQVEVSLILLNNGADIHVANNSNTTPLHYILRNNHMPIIRHLAKLNNVEVPEPMQTLSKRAFSYYTCCQNEIEKMKSSPIGSSTATYYDILVASDHKMAFLASNNDIKEAMLESLGSYPEFSNDLKERLALGLERSCAIAKLKGLEITAGHVSLTYDSILRVAFYLSNDDIRNLIAAS